MTCDTGTRCSLEGGGKGGEKKGGKEESQDVKKEGRKILLGITESATTASLENLLKMQIIGPHTPDLPNQNF